MIPRQWMCRQKRRAIREGRSSTYLVDKQITWGVSRKKKSEIAVNGALVQSPVGVAPSGSESPLRHLENCRGLDGSIARPTPMAFLARDGALVLGQSGHVRLHQRAGLPLN